VNTPVSLERSLTGTRSLMGAMPAPSQALPAPICAAGEGCELSGLKIIAKLATEIEVKRAEFS